MHVDNDQANKYSHVRVGIKICDAWILLHVFLFIIIRHGHGTDRSGFRVWKDWILAKLRSNFRVQISDLHGLLLNAPLTLELLLTSYFLPPQRWLSSKLSLNQGAMSMAVRPPVTGAARWGDYSSRRDMKISSKTDAQAETVNLSRFLIVRKENSGKN